MIELKLLLTCVMIAIVSGIMFYQLDEGREPSPLIIKILAVLFAIFAPLTIITAIVCVWTLL